MQAVEAPQLLDRALVVVDAEVDDDVGEPRVAAVPLDDEERRGLLAAPVAARSLGGGEARSRRSASEPSVASNVSASASTVAPETRMFPCAA